VWRSPLAIARIGSRKLSRGAEQPFPVSTDSDRSGIGIGKFDDSEMIEREPDLPTGFT
jgi:hypothetical protein